MTPWPSRTNPPRRTTPAKPGKGHGSKCKVSPRESLSGTVRKKRVRRGHAPGRAGPGPGRKRGRRTRRNVEKGHTRPPIQTTAARGRGSGPGRERGRARGTDVEVTDLPRGDGPDREDDDPVQGHEVDDLGRGRGHGDGARGRGLDRGQGRRNRSPSVRRGRIFWPNFAGPNPTLWTM